MKGGIATCIDLSFNMVTPLPSLSAVFFSCMCELIKKMIRNLLTWWRTLCLTGEVYLVKSGFCHPVPRLWKPGFSFQSRNQLLDKISLPKHIQKSHCLYLYDSLHPFCLPFNLIRELDHGQLNQHTSNLLFNLV